MQASAPRLYAARWSAARAARPRARLAFVLAASRPASRSRSPPTSIPTLVVVIGLAVFGVVFALNSAVHSYLILAYSDGDKVAMNVGFYYMANAGGRLVGTVLSGALYQWRGLSLPVDVGGIRRRRCAPVAPASGRASSRASSGLCGPALVIQAARSALRSADAFDSDGAQSRLGAVSRPYGRWK